VLVFGDRAARVAPAARLREITAAVRAVEQAPPGPGRHDLLTRAFLDAAGLAQGLADTEFAERGCDDLSPAQEAAMALLIMLARKVTASAWSGYAALGPAVAPELLALALQPLPDEVFVRTPEGFAFYAVYPEAVLKAAAEHPWPATPLVIGLRSIGAALAPLAAAVTGARTVLTLRPHGPPFRRQLTLSPRLTQLIRAHDGPFAVIDEGPGLSGSSFGATADLLEDLGVAPARVVFLPSHRGGPGPEASPRHRARWARAARAVATFEDLTAETPLAEWFADLTGPASSVEDLSGGAWREAASALPANPAQERLKFRLSTASGRWLARFAGLGRTGEAKLERARALHRAGFVPEPLALRRGFLLERWEASAPLARIPRERLVERLGAYLAFRAAAFPAPAEAGAEAEALLEMARVNIAETLGTCPEPLLRARAARAAEASPPRPVHVDGRLHAWEWLATPDDLLLKADAVDHSEAHDLVGCQDIAWDVAGAAFEHDLAPEEVAVICDFIEAAAGERPHPARLSLFELCYPAFQVGLWRMAGEPVQSQRYADRLAWLAAAAESAD